MPVCVWMLTGNMEPPSTQHIATIRHTRTKKKSAPVIKTWGNYKMWFTCPFVFAATAAPSAGFSTAASSFPAVLEICAPMLFGATKEPQPIKWMNKDRKASSPPLKKKSSQTPAPPSSRETKKKSSRKPKWPQRDVREVARWRRRKMWQRCKKKREFFQFFFFFSSSKSL